MSTLVSSQDLELWPCNWNWCPKAFDTGHELKKHLEQEHFNNILKVPKKDWLAHLRGYGGKSAATDRLLVGPPPSSRPSTPSASIQHQQDVRKSLSPTSSVPELPSTASPGQSRHRSHSSFADYATQSSPMMSPLVASLPASPALASLVADVVQSAGHQRASSKSATAWETSPFSPSLLSQLPQSTHPQFAKPTPGAALQLFSTHVKSISLESSGSALEVETQLTCSEDVYSPRSQQQGSQVGAQNVSQGPAQSSPYPPLRTQAPYNSQTPTSPESLADMLFDVDVISRGLDRAPQSALFRSGTINLGLDDTHPGAGVSSQISQVPLNLSSQLETQTQRLTTGYIPYVSPFALRSQAAYSSQSQSQ